MSNDSAFFIINSKERRQVAAEYVSRLSASPVMVVWVKEYRDTRSSAQNRLLWSWHKIIAKELGYSEEDLHEALKARILGMETKTILGKEVTMAKSTKNLSTKEFTEFLNGVEQFAHSLNIRLPIDDGYNQAMGIKDGKAAAA